jgi:DNA-binding transcriptional MerR regulator
MSDTDVTPEPAEPEPVGRVEMLTTGATYRQLDYWTRAGWLSAEPVGSGRSRKWSQRDREIARAMVRLIAAGVNTSTAARIATSLVESGATSMSTLDGVTISLRPERVLA